MVEALVGLAHGAVEDAVDASDTGAHRSREADALALPLVIAGVAALVAATTLRLVAWRLSGVITVIAER